MLLQAPGRQSVADGLTDGRAKPGCDNTGNITASTSLNRAKQKHRNIILEPCSLSLSLPCHPRLVASRHKLGARRRQQNPSQIAGEEDTRKRSSSERIFACLCFQAVSLDGLDNIVQFFLLLRRSTPVTMAYLQPPRRFQDCFTCHLDLARTPRTKPALQGTIQNITGFKACGFLGRCDCNHRSITNTCALWPSLRMVFSYRDPLGGRGCGGVFNRYPAQLFRGGLCQRQSALSSQESATTPEPIYSGPPPPLWKNRPRKLWPAESPLPPALQLASH